MNDIHHASDRLHADPDLHLMVDGIRIDPFEIDRQIYRFKVPSGTQVVRLKSRASIPFDLGISSDIRRLGFCVQRLEFQIENDAFLHIIEPHDAGLVEGFYEVEGKVQRWTRGDALLPNILLGAGNKPVHLTVIGKSLVRYSPGNSETPETLVDLQKSSTVINANDSGKNLSGDINILVRNAQKLQESGRSNEALEAHQQICQLAPQDPKNWERWCLLLIALGRVNVASEVISTASKVLTISPINLMSLGNICESALFLDEARKFFELAVEQDPRKVGALGQFCFRQGFLRDSLKYLNQARELEPISVDIAKAFISQLEICETLGISQAWIRDHQHDQELLLPELLYESMVKELLDLAPIYKPVRGRVILITSSLAGGGAERQFVNTVRGLVKRTKEIESVTLLFESLGKRFNKDFYLHQLSGLSLDIVVRDQAEQLCLDNKMGETCPRWIEVFPEDQRKAIRFYYQEIRARRPEVVHAWQDATCLNVVVAAALAGVPRIILSTRSMRPDNPYRRSRRYMQRGYMAVMQLPSVMMLSNSRAGAEDYEDWLRLQPGKVGVVYNGLDFDLLLRAADNSDTEKYRKLYKIPENAPVIGGVFRMSEEKRPLLWIETAAEISKRLPNAHFVIAGDGPMRVEMQELAQKLGFLERLHLPGQVSVPSWFQLMDVLLLTSRMEGLSNALLEAQSFGIPIVAPDVGGCAETIEQGVTGFVVENATALSLAVKVVFILADHAWVNLAKVAAVEHVKKKFSVDAMIDSTIRAYGLNDHEQCLASSANQSLSLCTLSDATYSIDADNKSNVNQIRSQFVENNSIDVNANFKLAESFFSEEKYTKAADHLKIVVANEPLNFDGWRLLGRAQTELKEFEDALSSWRKVLTFLPDDFEGLYRAGEILLKLNDSLLACHLLGKAYQLNFKRHDLAQVLASYFESLIDDKKTSEALKLIVCLEKNLYNTPAIKLQVTRVFIENKEYEKALLLSQELLALNSDDASASGLLILALTYLNEFENIFKYIADAPPKALSADWAIFAMLYHYRATGFGETLGLLFAIKKISESHESNQIVWSVRLKRLAGLVTQARQELQEIGEPSLLNKDLRLELAHCMAESPDWMQGKKFYEEFANTDENVSETDSMSAWSCRVLILEQNLKKDACEENVCKFPDSIFEVIFHNTKNPTYTPIKGRVALINGTMGGGGAERMMAHTFLGMKNSQEYQAELWLYSINPDLKHNVVLEGLGIQASPLEGVHELPTKKNVRHPFSLLPGQLGANAERIHDYIQLRRPEVVHAWQDSVNIETAFACVIAGVRHVVVNPRNMRADTVHHQTEYVSSFRRAYIALLKRPEFRLVCVSKAAFINHMTWLGIEPCKRFSVVYNGFEWGDFPTQQGIEEGRVDFRARLGVCPETKLVGGVFRFVALKRPFFWIDVARHLLKIDPSIRFVLYGDGKELENVKSYAKRLGILDKVFFLGYMQTVRSELFFLDALLHTSETEGLPGVIIEAGSAGVPIVAADVGGVRECVDVESGILIPLEYGSEQFGKALFELVESPFSYAERRKFAMRIRDRFKLSEMIDQFIDIYRGN
jgi:glycosyltransferase involved in cell wall biosynthesis/cytochrome c-type biogenesis protein CcmH/NrfG